jgi:HD-GYP domain-containing protein (c-di-GMP phosphodiesterase class II)
MLLDRPERIAFKVDEALVLLEYRNLKDKDNRYLEDFKKFVNEMQEVLV